MLDQLEAGITALRDRNRELEPKASTAPRKKTASRRKTSAKKKPAATKKKSRNTGPAVSVEREPIPATGKRQALGRSIIQLRRPAADARAATSTPQSTS